MRTPRPSRRQPKIHIIFAKILSRLGEIDGMAMNTQSLSDSARISLLARIAHSLTICARDTYEVGTDNILEPQVLRSYNELLHRVTGAVVSHVLGREGYSLESILEMIQAFGARHNRVEEMNWFLNWEPYAVMALVRFCAGGDQRWSSLPRHLGSRSGVL